MPLLQEKVRHPDSSPLLKIPRTCFNLHNTFLQFQAIAMPSLYFFALVSFLLCSFLKISLLLIVSILVYQPCGIYYCNICKSDRFTREIIMSYSEWSVINHPVLPSIACSLKLDLVTTLLKSKNCFLLCCQQPWAASNWGSRNIGNHFVHTKVDCITFCKDVVSVHTKLRSSRLHTSSQDICNVRICTDRSQTNHFALNK